ncbi:WG repeat-containing protein [Entomomonas asaccharolytica]|uniref:WG repeat-containing protein n=1 Tax=Entomomonas asaccharolytica TaxID=2785331 RepID=A0A974RX74_9GAMM|nr:WG repeat-containing protein [Entomomonas asaccharolytica]QQP85897.1 WG repeat-containing protein [Entomomonas asaccharolytica]
MQQVWIIRILKTNNTSDYFVLNDKGQFFQHTLRNIGNATDTTNGLLINAANQDNQWGYLNYKGEWAIEPQFEQAKMFTSAGFARVQIDKKWGIIDTTGKFIIPCQYPYSTPIDNQFWFATNQDRKTFLFSLSDLQQYPLTLPPLSESAIFSPRPTLHNIKIFDSLGLVPIIVTTRESYYTAYFNNTAEMVVHYKEGIGCPFSCKGAAPFKDAKTNRYGLINTNGEWILKPTYQKISNYNQDNLAYFNKDNSTGGCLDAKGNIIFEFPLDESFDDSSLNCGLIRTKESFIKQGSAEVIINFAENNIEYAHSFFDISNISIIRSKENNQTIEPKWGIANSKGEIFYKQHWIEPLSKYKDNGYYYNSLIGHNHTLPAFITNQNSIEYVLSDGEIIATLQFNEDNALLKDNQQNIIVSYSKNQIEQPELLFNRDFHNTPNYTDAELKALIDELLSSPAQPFKFVDFIYDDHRNESRKIHPYNEYHINYAKYDEDELAILPCGSIKTIAVTYYSEYDWGNYLFLSDQSFSLYQKNYLILRTQLMNLLGEPNITHCDDEENYTEWKTSDNRFITLLSRAYTGDGDFQTMLCLYVSDKFYNNSLKYPEE